MNCLKHCDFFFDTILFAVSLKIPVGPKYATYFCDISHEIFYLLFALCRQVVNFGLNEARTPCNTMTFLCSYSRVLLCSKWDVCSSLKMVRLPWHLFYFQKTFMRLWTWLMVFWPPSGTFNSSGTNQSDLQCGPDLQGIAPLYSLIRMRKD